MTAQPHPQRCETCKHYKLEPEFDECMKCNHPDFKDDVFMHEIHGYEFDRIEKMGCASHSASSQQRIEQVIKELERLASEEEQLKKESKTNEPWMGHAYANSAYLKAIAILRGEQR